MNDDDRSIMAFCRRQDISHSTFYKLCKAGRGPRVLRVPETGIARVTPEAEADWVKEMENTRSSAKLIKRATNAGRLSAASPRHFSNQRRKRRA